MKKRVRYLWRIVTAKLLNIQHNSFGDCFFFYRAFILLTYLPPFGNVSLYAMFTCLSVILYNDAFVKRTTSSDGLDLLTFSHRDATVTSERLLISRRWRHKHSAIPGILAWRYFDPSVTSHVVPRPLLIGWCRDYNKRLKISTCSLFVDMRPIADHQRRLTSYLPPIFTPLMTNRPRNTTHVVFFKI